MSLLDPQLKMSKSHPDPRSRILITDSPEDILKKINSARTDMIDTVSYDPEHRPGVANLLHLLSYFDPDGRSPAELGTTHEGTKLGAFKKEAAQVISSNLAPIRKRWHEVMREDDGAYIDYVERIGAKKARESADATMAIVREAIGL